MTKLQEIVKKAKALKKAYPKKYSKWTDYIKAASKSISGYTGTSKSGNKTTVHYTNAKATTKKTTAKQGKLFGTKTHKDTRSHNVNVKVVSGVIPHKAKYYIQFTKEDGTNITEYFDAKPKGVYFAEGYHDPKDRGLAYVMRLTNKGTALIPLKDVKTEKQIRKK